LTLALPTPTKPISASYTRLQPVEVLEKMQAQVNESNSYVVHQTTIETVPTSEVDFRRSLQKLADVYRSCGLKKGDERIMPTVSFVVLKYIGEKEKMQRTLHGVVKIWDDYGKERGNFRADFEQSLKDVFNKDYGDTYSDFRELVGFSSKLKNEHYKLIHEELSKFHFHGCNFDVFGAIYEEFASQTKKKEFGEFYTRRHITGIVARLLLRNEVTGRDLKICDPACGSGGFLTEAYKVLVNNYSRSGKMNAVIQKKLSNDTFWGYDNDETSVARAKLNMFLVGDGHTHIYRVHDSLDDWDAKVGWEENSFDYVLANPPMGPYSGETLISNFDFTNERRYEMLFVEKIIRAVKPGGEIAVIVPDGMLEAPSREHFRVKLLDHCDIHAVISLTKFAFAPYTKEKTYVLFMRKKQDDQVGQRQNYPIWHFIVDYDSFANSDKRYKTKWHDDLPELEDRFDAALRHANYYSQDKGYFEQKRNEFERSINHREISESLSGAKYAYVDPSNINPNNFHNLLSEYYLRPVSTVEIEEVEFNDKAIKLLQQFALFEQATAEASGVYTIGSSSHTISEMFDYLPGNHGLTEEIIYEQQPTSEEDSVPIFSGSQDNETPIGYICRNANNKDGKPISYFEGPCLILTKDGSAGLLTFKEKGQEFTINHHACVLKVKEDWTNKVHLRWFAHRYQKTLFQAVTSKSDNRVFSTEWFERLKFDIPLYDEQVRQWRKIEQLIQLKYQLRSASMTIEQLLSSRLKVDK
jgi:type I restriction-modification system DNA methylase subunit